jgi:hypothetical protein
MTTQKLRWIKGEVGIEYRGNEFFDYIYENTTS